MAEAFSDPSLDQPYAGRIVDGAHRFAVRVYHEDTDAVGVVYYANYLRFIERARSDMLALAGIDQAGVLASGEGAYVVADVAIRYRRSARLHDALVVVSQIEAIRSAGLTVHQRVMRGDDVIADAHVGVAFVGTDGRPRRQPKPWIEAFAAVSAGARSAA